MLFKIDGEGAVDPIATQKLAELGLREREDLQEWVIDEPRILGEELLIVTSEYAGFERTLDRLDVLALDRAGKLVVIELKRDKADQETDLQALKYASFCSTLTAEDIQQLYREFHDERTEDNLSPEEVGERFTGFIDTDEAVTTADNGFAEFELDDKPRVILAAGDFGTEITSPVLWLRQEYGLNISCIRISAYERNETYLVQGQQIIPVPETEKYMTKRREKDEEQNKKPSRGKPTITVLRERGVLQEGDKVLFNEDLITKDWMPDVAEERWDPNDDFWQAIVTGDQGQSNNVRWLYDDETYSFTGLTRAVLHDMREGQNFSEVYEYWTHPDFDHKTLKQLREERITA